MNMFKRERAPAQTPAVPPRPTPQDLENPVTHSIHKQDTTTEQTQRSGVMGVMHKVNPFKSSSAQPPSGVCKAPSSESLENCTGSSAQNPGVFRGVMQKVNPFKSISQPQVSKAPSSETLDQEKSVDINQNPGVFKGVIQKVSPFKTTTQNDMTCDNVETPESENEPQTPKQNPGVMSGMMQKVNPFKSSSQAPKNDLAESQATNDMPQSKQNPRVFSGMIQKVNPFKSQPKDAKLVHSDLSSSEGSLNDNNLPDQKISTDENAKSPDLPPRPEQQMLPNDNKVNKSNFL